jgi:hypothetical protein
VIVPPEIVQLYDMLAWALTEAVRPVWPSLTGLVVMMTGCTGAAIA